MSGLERIRNAFAAASTGALMPYFTLGYPDLPTSLDIIEACCRAGAALMELGLPFSDPLADGPTIQRSTQVALENGVTTGSCLLAVAALRRRGVTTPFLLMGYTNPMLRFGAERFVREAAAAGADGFILPDLPPEEAGDFAGLCARFGLANVHLLAPNSTAERTRLALDRTSGFLYLVSVTGVTGARAALSVELGGVVERVQALNERGIPLAVGFGIQSADQVQAVAELADGVIVGSALIERVRGALAAGENPAIAAGEFVRSLLP